VRNISYDVVLGINSKSDLKRIRPTGKNRYLSVASVCRYAFPFLIRVPNLLSLKPFQPSLVLFKIHPLCEKDKETCIKRYKITINIQTNTSL
jgi:hypothetical protein